MPGTEGPGARQLDSVQRAVEVLDALAEAGGELGTLEVARRTGINTSTTSRMLATLAASGLVERVPATGRYRLGLRLVHLGNAALGRLGLRDLARTHLADLAELTGETATLSAAGEGEAVTLDYVASPASVRSEARVGRVSIAHATAVGKVLLAHGGRLPDGPLAAFTGRTITGRAALEAEVARVRRRGWAQALREREADVNALAAPVLEPSGRLLAILGIQGPASRFTTARMRAAREPLLERARLLGGEPGYAEGR